MTLKTQMEPQISLDCNSCLHPKNHVKGEGIPGSTISLQDKNASTLPVKRPTRQWAAWTHQEEESFFSALRQVGKNFEKITCRVQSKNKDQVRHYYYRLVRRMNKLLGPELCLDAKNSKDTNAAMLRWWSLLEKYSCKASKLHLKPRRFKLFVETLETQLLKDRKKNVRKRASQGENSSITAPTGLPNQGKVSCHESRVVKDVLIDSQNIPKPGIGKGSSIHRHLNIGINRGNYKSGPSALKTARYQRKTGATSKAAYKRWEKAAIAGVSLVADAAEHLERTATDREVEHVEDAHVQNAFDYRGKDMPSILNNMQSSMKLKLQLFPVDEATRRALEMDKHNPYLELTLSARKKISSVLEHLNRKWGQSSIASGELMLLPYFVQAANLVSCHKWAKDSVLSASDVYAQIGNPPVFRLRYGWFPHADPGSATSLASLSCPTQHHTETSIVNEQIVDTTPKSSPPTYQEAENLLGIHEGLLSATKMITSTPSRLPNDTIGCAGIGPDVNTVRSSNHTAAHVLNRRESTTDRVVEQEENLDDLRPHKTVALSAGEWADSLTNISTGDLLTEASHNGEVNCIDSTELRNSHCLQQIPFSCDSFDAAIAAHIYKHQSRSALQPPLHTNTSSIWDGEETCDAFVFQKNSVFSEEFQNASRISPPETSREITSTSSAASGKAQESDPEEPLTDDPRHGDIVDKCHSDQHSFDDSQRELNGLTDIYWPDSLGALDLDISSCRYRSDDLILSDSLGGLNRLIASSLDAFQSCSFFGSDKKESASAVEAGEIASDLKISTQV
ncbi:LOW QUALITY PROTEIN: TSL-kinase interacting protein 1 [Coffea arabica]|uniref:LOW QUALITY PROTEIN: TSL-kinase interacting protein 1 n=1 Tax=Coffea arabica TaxID=13443 RepID=A0ABM4U9S0_COFAR